MYLLVQRLKKEDERLADVICESLKTAYDPSLSKFFVHQDLAYKSFFKSTIGHPSYATYYCYDNDSDELLGFACFQFIDEIIFLKHIVVNNKLRGSRIGTTLLYESLHSIQGGLSKSKFFQLHVFESNSKALIWYLSIGMEVLDCSYWYDLYTHELPIRRSPLKIPKHLTRNPDSHGFIQVNYKDFHLGTLINNRTLLIKDARALEFLPIFSDFAHALDLKAIGFVSDKPYDDFKIVDKSFLMSLPIDKLVLLI